MKTVVYLAWRDLLREPKHVFCVVALIAGVVAPLILLFSIRSGIMDTVIGSLQANPANRQMELTGNHYFEPSELERLRAWPEISFVVPLQRSIARRIDVRPPDAPKAYRMRLWPSETGDPLLPPGMVLESGQVAVSAGLADLFDLQVGDVLRARAQRGVPPTARLLTDLDVVHILERGWLSGRSGLVPSAFVSDMEAFYDTYALPHYGIESGKPLSERSEQTESFRIYAVDLETVAALERRLRSELGFGVNSRADEAAFWLNLNKNVGLALEVLALSAVSGLTAALVALFWSGVERKRRTLSLLSLMGTRPFALALFPLVQAVVYAISGALAACVLFVLTAQVTDELFGAELETIGVSEVAPVQPYVLLGVTFGLVGIALIAAGVAARHAFKSDPAVAIRLES